MKKNNVKHDGYYYADRAERSGCKVDFDCNNHILIQSPDKSSMLMIPKAIKRPGTEFAILKWLIRVGVLLTLIFGALKLAIH